ncbi:MAG: helix-turn-helix domain-containing protein [Mycobacterium sp.]
MLAEIAEIREDPQVLRDSVEGNIDTVLSAIRYAIPIENVEPPTAALEQARRYAQRGVSVTALMRGYRLGHMALVNAALAKIRLGNLDPQLGLDVVGYIAETTFGYIDWITQQVVYTYQGERDRWMENRNSMRTMRVRELLDGTDGDVDAMTSEIRYPFRQIHLALVVWTRGAGTDEDLVKLERFVQQLGQYLGAGDASLFIPADRSTAWAWIPAAAQAASTAVARIRTFIENGQDAPRIAVGIPLPGIEGFRRSHQQAQGAYTLATSPGSPARQLTAASDPGFSVAALFGQNMGAASIWVADVLGPLAGRTDNDAVLRDTLRVFLSAGSSHKAAAEVLHLHANSVKYRVRRALERRGRAITDDRLDVEVALQLCHWLGAPVLG